MKNKSRILVAFVLNFAFSVFELIGGAFVGSVAILSDALHDMGDAVGIGVSYFCEQHSQKKPDAKHTYGFIRYSVLGGFITTLILLFGSVGVIYQAVLRMMNPATIHYNGMVAFGIVGIIVNGIAAYFTHGGHSVNQRAVNLHMLEDVLGWIAVLLGAVVMKFTGLDCLDGITSIIIAVYILFQALKNLKTTLNIFLEKTPDDINLDELHKAIEKIEGVKSVQRIHIRSLDGYRHDGAVHLIVQGNEQHVKKELRTLLREYHIIHVTIETGDEKLDCDFNFNEDHHCHKH